MDRVESKFASLATDNAPGQEVRQRVSSDTAFRGDPLPGRPVEAYRDQVEPACANALAAAARMLDEGESLESILSLSVFVAADDDFVAHSRVADFASDNLFRELGEAGIGARAALGVATLPGGAAVEIQLVGAVGLTRGVRAKTVGETGRGGRSPKPRRRHPSHRLPGSILARRPPP